MLDTPPLAGQAGLAGCNDPGSLNPLEDPIAADVEDQELGTGGHERMLTMVRPGVTDPETPVERGAWD